MEPRVLAAGLLGVGLGLVLVVFPDAAVRVHLAGRLPTDRGGEYGDDTASGPRVRLAVRAIGVAVLVIGVWFLRRGLT